MLFYERLRKALDIKGITEYRLSKIAGLSKSTINALTNGTSKQPNIQTIEKIAHALGMTVSELTGEEKQPNDEWTLIIEKAKEHNVSPEKLEKLIDFLIEEK
jgi:XRE family transcriptional regulator of biofilm formation